MGAWVLLQTHMLNKEDTKLPTRSPWLHYGYYGNSSTNPLNYQVSERVIDTWYAVVYHFQNESGCHGSSTDEGA